jgi:hypothetical protein
MEHWIRASNGSVKFGEAAGYFHIRTDADSPQKIKLLPLDSYVILPPFFEFNSIIS